MRKGKAGNTNVNNRRANKASEHPTCKNHRACAPNVHGEACDNNRNNSRANREQTKCNSSRGRSAQCHNKQTVAYYCFPTAMFNNSSGLSCTANAMFVHDEDGVARLCAECENWW